MVKREAVVTEARSWLGTPWQHQQRTKGLACDCIGLVGGVALALDLPGSTTWAGTPGFHDYGRAPDPDLLLAGCDLLLDEIRPREARPGDVLVLRFKRDPQHFAILTTPTAIIHALSTVGKVAEARLDTAWLKRIFAAYRYRGVE